MNYSVGLFLFDFAYRNLQTNKPKNKKKREIKDLGLKVEFIPSFFACITPRNNSSS